MATLWEVRSGVRFPVGTRDALFSKRFRLALTCNPVSYSVVVWSSSSRGKVAIQHPFNGNMEILPRDKPF